MRIHHSLGCSQRIINNNRLSLIPYDSPQVHVISNTILPTNNQKLQSPHTEELVHLLLRQRIAPLLELGNQFLHLADEDLLHFAGQHATRRVILADARQLRIVVQEVLQILIRHVLRQICAELPLLLDRLAAAAHRVAIDLLVSLRQSYLVLDHVRRVGHVDARVGVRRAHLRVQPHQRGDELAVHQRRLELAQPRRHVARHAEVGVLVDRTGNHAAQLLLAQHAQKGRREGWSRLDGGERLLADVRGLGEAEDRARLRGREGGEIRCSR